MMMFFDTTTDVDDPEKCHDHSEIPDKWPQLDEITKYQSDIRARFTESIESGRSTLR